LLKEYSRKKKFESSYLIYCGVRQTYLAIILCLLCCPAHGQQKSQPYNVALRRLEGRTWLLEKRCINDTCASLSERDFFVFLSKEDAELSKKDTSTLVYQEWVESADDATVRRNVCTAYLNFYPSGKEKNNSFSLFYLGEAGKQFGELSFLSDSSFVIRIRHIEWPEHIQDYREDQYFKMAVLPKGIK